jgi:hypothetical protein
MASLAELASLAGDADAETVLFGLFVYFIEIGL